MTPYYDDQGITIYHGDCRDVLPSLAKGSVDLLLTDPPYASAAATITTGFAREKWGGNWGDMSLLPLMASQIIGQPFLSPSHQVYWFCDHFAYAALMPYFFPRYALVQNIVWDKDMLGVGGCYRKQTELIIYARTSGAPLLPKDRRDLIRLRPSYATKRHPAEKPLELIRGLAGDSDWACALDPYAGSGTTLVAAKMLGRKAIGIEIEERYCELAALRVAESAFGAAPPLLKSNDVGGKGPLFDEAQMVLTDGRAS